MTGPSTASAAPVDVLIIGAGVVGTAIARTLAQYDLDCVVADAGNDVGTGTTKANTAILHTGFDAVPDSLESTLVRRGAELLRRYAAQAGIPLERTGALLIAWTADQAASSRDSNTRRGSMATTPPGRFPRISSTPESRIWGQAPWAHWRFRTKASSARGPPRWPMPSRRCGPEPG